MSETVFIVDDDAAVRDSVAMLLGTVNLATETFPSAEDFFAGWDPSRPGCLLLDLRMPGMSGLGVQQELAERGSRIPVVFLTAHGDVQVAVQAMKAGAVDFLQKPFRDDELIERVQKALEVDRRQRALEVDEANFRSRLAELTPREREVMDHVVSGAPNKAIAMDLGLSERTIEIHRSRAMKKMGVTSLAELVRMVTENRTES